MGIPPIRSVPGRGMIGRPQLRTGQKGRAGMRARIAGFAYVALLPPAAFAVHQLRYMLAFGGHAGIELQRTGHSYLHSVVPWLVAAVGVGCRWVPAGAGPGVRGSDVCGAFHAVADGVVDGVLGRAGRDFRCARSSSRDCSRPGIRAAWRVSSATAAGGRSRWRCASAWCWQRCCTALAGSCGRSYAGEGVPIWLLLGRVAARGASPRRCGRAVRRRWSRAGRFGVRREAVETRCSLAASPWRILPPR